MKRIMKLTVISKFCLSGTVVNVVDEFKFDMHGRTEYSIYRRFVLSKLSKSRINI